MDKLKILTALAFGSVLLAGCGAHKDESTAETGSTSPAVETPAPAPEDMTTPADSSGIPSNEPAPASADTLPTDQQPPPEEGPPPPNN